MITIVKSTETALETIDQATPGAWLNVVAPTAAESTELQALLGVPQDFVTYPLDIDERARIEKENGALLIVLRVPQFQGEKADIPYITVPLGIIITESYLVTVSQVETEAIGELTRGRTRLSTTKRNRFVLRLLLTAANIFLRDLRTINKIVDALEDRLYYSLRNREVVELLKYQKSLVYFTTALKANEMILLRLQRSGLFRQYPEDEDLLDDAVTEVEQAIEMTNISSNILSQMMDAFASIISNNLNVVMKFLASVTIILSLPTMLASFYGMNVKLPLEEHPWAFAIIMGISVVVALGVVVLFWRKDWL